MAWESGFKRNFIGKQMLHLHNKEGSGVDTAELIYAAISDAAYKLASVREVKVRE